MSGLESSLLLFVTGVDGLVPVMGGRVCKAGNAFFRRDIYGFEKNFESELFVLLYHLR